MGELVHSWWDEGIRADNITSVLQHLLEIDTMLPGIEEFEYGLNIENPQEEEYNEGVSLPEQKRWAGYFDDRDAIFEYIRRCANGEINLQGEITQEQKVAEEAKYQVEKAAEENSNKSFLEGAYLRFNTIYSYGKAKENNKVYSTQQEPHTLAHVSVNFLLNNANTFFYPLKKQVLTPRKVRKILAELGVMATDSENDYGPEDAPKVSCLDIAVLILMHEGQLDLNQIPKKTDYTLADLMPSPES